MTSSQLIIGKPPEVTAAGLGVKVAPMILAASQPYFWYFGYPTPLAPAEDRSA
jgi:hypothetical protein